MTAKDYCKANPAVAYVSRNAGLEIHGVEYGATAYVYVCRFGSMGRHSRPPLPPCPH